MSTVSPLLTTSSFAWKDYKPTAQAYRYQGFEQTLMESDKPVEDKLHQWPWRGFAFASDLGILAQLLRKPKLAGVGWLIALPYYGYSLVSKPSKEKRIEEAVYQLTANGLCPLIEVKLGIIVGKLVGVKFPKIALPVWKGAGGLLALAVLTPAVGDPVSSQIVQKYQAQRGNQC
jgi:hypothetical protein